MVPSLSENARDTRGRSHFRPGAAVRFVWVGRWVRVQLVSRPEGGKVHGGGANRGSGPLAGAFEATPLSTASRPDPMHYLHTV
jgi:hypothetical protein